MGNFLKYLAADLGELGKAFWNIFVGIFNFFKMLFTPAPTCNVVGGVKVSAVETATQFALLALVFWLGMCPPQFFVDLINDAVQLLTY